jgi:hypothetical protein
MNSTTHHLANNQTVGAGFAVGALFNLIIADIAEHDAFLHGIASILTGLAAIVSIYLAIKRKKG